MRCTVAHNVANAECSALRILVFSPIPIYRYRQRLPNMNPRYIWIRFVGRKNKDAKSSLICVLKNIIQSMTHTENNACEADHSGLNMSLHGSPLILPLIFNFVLATWIQTWCIILIRSYLLSLHSSCCAARLFLLAIWSFFLNHVKFCNHIKWLCAFWQINSACVRVV